MAKEKKKKVLVLLLRTLVFLWHFPVYTEDATFGVTVCSEWELSAS